MRLGALLLLTRDRVVRKPEGDRALLRGATARHLDETREVPDQICGARVADEVEDLGIHQHLARPAIGLAAGSEVLPAGPCVIDGDAVGDGIYIPPPSLRSRFA